MYVWIRINAHIRTWVYRCYIGCITDDRMRRVECVVPKESGLQQAQKSQKEQGQSNQQHQQKGVTIEDKHKEEISMETRRTCLTSGIKNKTKSASIFSKAAHHETKAAKSRVSIWASNTMACNSLLFHDYLLTLPE